MTQTLSSANDLVIFDDYIIPLGRSTLDIQEIVLMLFRQAGALGNAIFFVCSAWFLIGKDKYARKKAFLLVINVWVISFLFLIVYLYAGFKLRLDDLKYAIFPNIYSSNWYMTCYIIFLLIYPWLNKLIGVLNQRQLLRIVLFSSILWILFDFVITFLFFASNIILWITIYFLMAYLKLYCSQAMTNKKVGIILLAIGFAGYVFQVLITNYIGLYLFKYFSTRVLRWNSNQNPFYLMMAIGFLIIALDAKFKNYFINYLSSLSMFVYLIHENYLFRNYTRPYLWHFLYLNYGYEHVVLLDLGLSLVLYVISIILASLFKETIGKIVNKVSNSLYIIVSKMYRFIEKFIIEKIY